ncbi:uncharacterized protein LOC110830910 isoform X3 [Zootermopsis nevadensis]|uniref:uncharacterized protein LOC110830910 isoform X3 n=1 Tax=Zootermopsis nevadensis TaxID=136037 RepID=UPI000B8ED141|nr:uncharacterized protein LOC110830910 isoform X3 [Zootermopsis nevadensis]
MRVSSCATTKRSVMASMRPYREILKERRNHDSPHYMTSLKNMTNLNQGLRQRTNASSSRHHLLDCFWSVRNSWTSQHHLQNAAVEGGNYKRAV